MGPGWTCRRSLEPSNKLQRQTAPVGSRKSLGCKVIVIDVVLANNTSGLLTPWEGVVQWLCNDGNKAPWARRFYLTPCITSW